MKIILLWDPRFPASAPARLAVHDDVASACVRARIAAAADPAQQGALEGGPAVPADDLRAVALQHGLPGFEQIAHVVLPLAVAQIAAALGLCAALSGAPFVGGVTPPPTTPMIPAQFWTLQDSFANDPNGIVTSRPGLVLSGNGVQIENGKLRGTAQYGGFNALLDQVVTDNFELEIDYSLADGVDQPMDYNDPHRLILWSTPNGSAMVYVSLEPVAGLIRMTLAYNSGSGETYVANCGTFDTARAQGSIRLQVSGTELLIRQNGRWDQTPRYDNAFPLGRISLASIPSGMRTGRPGLQQFNRQPFLRGLRVRPLDMIAMVPTFYPRDNKSATKASAVPIHISYTGAVSPTQWVARVQRWEDLSVVQDWRTIDNPVVTNGIMTGTIPMPVTPFAGAYSIQAGFVGADGLLHVNRSDYCYIGRTIFWYGQSNSGQGAAASTDGQDMPGALSLFETGGAGLGGGGRDENGEPFAAGDPIYSWLFDHVFVDRAAANLTLLSTGRPGNISLGGHLYAMDGVPTAVLRKSYSATDIASIRASLNALTLPKLSRGWSKPEAVIWYQGENDLAPEYAPADINYPPKLAGVISDLRSAVGVPDLPWFIVPLSKNPAAVPGGSADGGDYTALNPQFPKMFAAQKSIIDSVANVYWADSTLGLPHGTGSDAIHLNGFASWEMNKRIAYSVGKYACGFAEPDGRGPLVASAAKTGPSQITLTLAMNGATTLTASGNLTGYEASIDDFATTIAGTWTIVGTSIRFTSSAALPAGTLKVRSFMDLRYDDSVLAMGGGYADARQAIPTFPAMPITVT